MMYGWNDGWGWGAWVAMGFMMLVFWGLVAAVVIAIFRSPSHRGEGPPPPGAKPEEDPLKILDQRFARGEIDADEYTSRRDLLRAR